VLNDVAGGSHLLNSHWGPVSILVWCVQDLLQSNWQWYRSFHRVILFTPVSINSPMLRAQSLSCRQRYDLSNSFIK
jgi:hypothetical protein